MNNNNIEVLDNYNDINNNPPVEILTNIPNKKNNKKIKIITISLVVLLVLIISGLIAYKEIVLFNKKDVIKYSIVEVFNQLDYRVDNINKNILPFNANEESIGIDGTFKMSSNYKDNDVDLTKLNNYIIKYNSALDLKNNKLSGNINLNKDDNTLLSLNTYINGKYGLVESSQLSYYAYNYNIGKEIKDINLNNTNNKDNLKKIIDRTRDLITSRLNENDITKDSVEETINGNKSNCTRFTYKININELVSEILKFYIQDTSITKTLSELTSTDVNTLKNNIQNIIDNNKDSEYVNYEIYVDNLFGKFKQLKIYNINNTNNCFVIYPVNNDYEYQIIYDNNKYTGKYSNNIISINTDNIKLELEKINDNEYKIINNTNNNGKYYNSTVNVKTKIENDKQNIQISANTITGKDNDSFDLNYDIDLNIYKNASVKPIMAFITKDISSIDQNEAQDIYERFINIFNRIIKDIYPNYYNVYNTSLLDFNISVYYIKKRTMK